MVVLGHDDALMFTIEPRTLIYAPQSRKVTRWDPPRLVAECPMPACEWYITGPNTVPGFTLCDLGRRNHATTVHPEALHAGGLVLDHEEAVLIPMPAEYPMDGVLAPCERNQR